MTRTFLALTLGAALATTALSGAASAQGRLPGESFDPSREAPPLTAPPLTVRKRPFTDSGTVVPQGYEQSYVTSQTVLNRPVYSSFAPDRFGQDVLPRPFDGLGLY